MPNDIDDIFCEIEKKHQEHYRKVGIIKAEYRRRQAKKWERVRFYLIGTIIVFLLAEALK